MPSTDQRFARGPAVLITRDLTQLAIAVVASRSTTRSVIGPVCGPCPDYPDHLGFRWPAFHLLN